MGSGGDGEQRGRRQVRRRTCPITGGLVIISGLLIVVIELRTLRTQQRQHEITTIAGPLTIIPTPK